MIGWAGVGTSGGILVDRITRKSFSERIVLCPLKGPNFFSFYLLLFKPPCVGSAPTAKGFLVSC